MFAFVGSVARAVMTGVCEVGTLMLVKPVLIGVQLAPLLLLLNIPAAVPAKSTPVEEMARACTFRFVKPVLAAVQVTPPCARRKMPPPLVPAKILPPASE